MLLQLQLAMDGIDIPRPPGRIEKWRCAYIYVYIYACLHAHADHDMYMYAYVYVYVYVYIPVRYI
jgi:hypothetical protein